MIPKPATCTEQYHLLRTVIRRFPGRSEYLVTLLCGLNLGEKVKLHNLIGVCLTKYPGYKNDHHHYFFSKPISTRKSTREGHVSTWKIRHELIRRMMMNVLIHLRYTNNASRPGKATW